MYTKIKPTPTTTTTTTTTKTTTHFAVFQWKLIDDVFPWWWVGLNINFLSITAYATICGNKIQGYFFALPDPFKFCNNMIMFKRTQNTIAVVNGIMLPRWVNLHLLLREFIVIMQLFHCSVVRHFTTWPQYRDIWLMVFTMDNNICTGVMESFFQDWESKCINLQLPRKKSFLYDYKRWFWLVCHCVSVTYICDMIHLLSSLLLERFIGDTMNCMPYMAMQCIFPCHGTFHWLYHHCD